MGTPLPLPQRGTAPPIFGPYLLRPNGCMDQDVTWYGARPRPRRLCVRWGSRCPFPKRGADPPKFSAHVYCDQTAGWMKLILGMVSAMIPWLIHWGLRPFCGGTGSPSNTKLAWAEAYQHAKYQLHPSSRLVTINMAENLGGPPPFWGGGNGMPI